MDEVKECFKCKEELAKFDINSYRDQELALNVYNSPYEKFSKCIRFCNLKGLKFGPESTLSLRDEALYGGP